MKIKNCNANSETSCSTRLVYSEKLLSFQKVGICSIDSHGREGCSCIPGFKLTATNDCIDVDECEQGTHDCGAHSVCFNTEGSFKCICRKGDRNSSRRDDCDKCKPGYGGKSGRNCKKCSPGFLRIGKSCDDINECGDISLCGKHGHCQNTPGSYMCNCNEGFELSENKSLCLRKKRSGSHQSINPKITTPPIEFKMYTWTEDPEYEMEVETVTPMLDEDGSIGDNQPVDSGDNVAFGFGGFGDLGIDFAGVNKKVIRFFNARILEIELRGVNLVFK